MNYPAIVSLDPATSQAIGAIYKDAHDHGYRKGFQTGISEKAWLHKNWPAILVTSCAASLFVGILSMWVQG